MLRSDPNVASRARALCPQLQAYLYPQYHCRLSLSVPHDLFGLAGTDWIVLKVCLRCVVAASDVGCGAIHNVQSLAI
jgi:hypothetical protein